MENNIDIEAVKSYKHLFEDVSDEPISIRDYLVALLFTLWDEGEGFSGKWPLGSSGWEIDLHHALVYGGFVKGDIDEYGDVLYGTFDERKANKIIFEVINSLE